MIDKARLIELIGFLPDDTLFDDDILSSAKVNIARVNEPVAIVFDCNPMTMPTPYVMGFEVMEEAERLGFRKSFHDVLVEELPNGTSRVIRQWERQKANNYSVSNEHKSRISSSVSENWKKRREMYGPSGIRRKVV
jgi:hypothetical protein